MVELDLGKLSFSVRKFKQLDGKLRDAISKANWVGFKKIFCDQAELVQGIKEDIAQEMAIVLPQNKQLADDLRRLRADDESFYYFYCWSILAGIPDKDANTEEPTDINSSNKGVEWARLFEEAESEAYELIGRDEIYTIEFSDGSPEKVVLDPYPFLERKHKVSALILGSHPPEAVRKHFETLRDLFILGRFEASVVFCRALLEEVYRHYRRRKGLSRTRDNIIDLYDESLNEMIRETPLPRNLKDFAHDTRDYVRRLIHTESGEFLHTSESEALNIIKGTIEVIEYMYK